MGSIRIENNVPIEMRDGTRLSADIYRPDDNVKHPAILQRSPYRNEITRSNDLFNWIESVQAGYIIVLQNIRGTFASEGKAWGGNMLPSESLDGYDTVEWIASQSWCDGNVGTVGGSARGMLQWMMAPEQPPHLKAISPWVVGAMDADPVAVTGHVRLAVLLNRATRTGLDIAAKLEEQGKDVSELRRMIQRATDDPSEVYNYLPLKDAPHFKDLKEIWNFQRSGSARTQATGKTSYAFEKVVVPVCQIGGWYDLFPSGLFYNFQQMKSRGGSALARAGQHALIGPWVHNPPPQRLVGDLDFGPQTDGQAAGVARFTRAFFDKYLRGMDIDLPAVRYLLMGMNEWKTADSLPLPQTQWQRFYLHSRGRANSARGDGELSLSEPGSERADSYLYDPHHPVPTTGGRGALVEAGFANGPKDQSQIELREDVLCYTTPQLEQDIEVTGSIELHLFAATSACDTDFAVKLVDVHPDGRSYNVSDGIVRARYRKSLSQAERVTPGEINEYVFHMSPTSQYFRRGHRIRLDVTSSNFPAFDRNMNTGNPIGEDAKGITALQSVYHETGCASYILLPIIPQS